LLPEEKKWEEGLFIRQKSTTKQRAAALNIIREEGGYFTLREKGGTNLTEKGFNKKKELLGNDNHPGLLHLLNVRSATKN